LFVAVDRISRFAPVELGNRVEVGRRRLVNSAIDHTSLTGQNVDTTKCLQVSAIRFAGSANHPRHDLIGKPFSCDVILGLVVASIELIVPRHAS
jgi:hypothetical protein